MDDTQSIEDSIRSLFTNPVQVAVSQDAGDVGMLYEEERKLIIHAAPKRQAEFAAGRLCARDALEDLGVNGSPILMDAKGAPIWPEGVIGSIAHAKGCCAAVVALDQGENSLGLDIEETGRVKESVWSYTFLPEEIEWLRLQSDESAKWASVIFGAKEAFYKAQYPLTHSWLGFQDVLINIDQGAGTFTARLLLDLKEWSQDEVFSGRYVFFDAYVAAGITLSEGFL